MITKVAAPDPSAVLNSLQQAQQSFNQHNLQKQVWNNAASIGAVGLGAGLGARGLWGLAQQLSRNLRKPKSTVPAPLDIEIPVEEIPEEEKLGAAAPGPLPPPSFSTGGSATTASGVPYALPLWGAAAIGSVGTGWTLADWLLDKRRKRNMKQELDSAKGEYNDALYGKTAELLAPVVARVTKKASVVGDLSSFAGNASGQALGAYGLYAGVGGLTAAMMAYNATKKRQRRTLLEAAQKQRQRERFEMMPTPIYATPVPVARDDGGYDDDDNSAAPALG